MVMSTPFLSFPSFAEAVVGEPIMAFCDSNVAAAPIVEVFRNSLLLFISCASCLCGKVRGTDQWFLKNKCDNECGAICLIAPLGRMAARLNKSQGAISRARLRFSLQRLLVCPTTGCAESVFHSRRPDWFEVCQTANNHPD